MKANAVASSSVALLLLLGLAEMGCSKKPKPAVTPPPGDGSTPGETTPTGDSSDPASDDGQMGIAFEDVFFDYDRAILRADAQSTLNKDGKVMMDNPDVRVMLEGHCDERGTTEYNLALGERRAQAARNYLVQYGVDGSRLSTISFGEERPFDPGHDEAAWAKNRRAHFVRQ